MNAPALNPASAPPAGSVGTTAAAAVAGKTSGALAGFEALLAALFPQGAVAASPDKADIDPSLGPGSEDPTDEALDANAAPPSGNASALPLVGAFPAQPVIANAVTETGPARPGRSNPRLWPRQGQGCSGRAGTRKRQPKGRTCRKSRARRRFAGRCCAGRRRRRAPGYPSPAPRRAGAAARCGSGWAAAGTGGIYIAIGRVLGHT